MKRKKLFAFCTFFLFVMLISCSKQNKAEKVIIKIGGGDRKDIFTPTTKIICRIINNDYMTDDIYAEPEITEGSNDNLKRLYRKELNLAIVNNISAVLAYDGQGMFKKIPEHSKIRSIAGMMLDALFFIVNTDAGINSFRDIKGKNIAMPSNDAAGGILAREILKYNGIKENDLNIYAYSIGESIQKMEEGKIDGFMYLTAQPNPYLYGITNSNKIKCKFISLNKDTINYLINKYPCLTDYKICKSMYSYSNNINDCETIGSRAILITTNEESNDLIYQITKNVCEDFSAFKEVNKSYLEIIPESMAESLTIPVHPGAYKYYRRAGLSKYISKELRPQKKQ